MGKQRYDKPKAIVIFANQFKIISDLSDERLGRLLRLLSSYCQDAENYECEDAELNRIAQFILDSTETARTLKQERNARYRAKLQGVSEDYCEEGDDGEKDIKDIKDEKDIKVERDPINVNVNGNVKGNGNGTVNNNPPNPLCKGEETPKPKSRKFALDEDNPPEWVAPELLPAFAMWLDYKRGKRQGYATEKTAALCYNRLVELSGGNPAKAAEIVKGCIAQNYDGLYSLGKDGERPQQGGKCLPTQQQAYEQLRDSFGRN